MINGMKVVVSRALPDGEMKQIVFPRSKRKRIRKKFTKDRHNWRLIPSSIVYQMGDVLVMNALTAEMLERHDEHEGE